MVRNKFPLRSFHLYQKLYVLTVGLFTTVSLMIILTSVLNRKQQFDLNEFQSSLIYVKPKKIHGITAEEWRYLGYPSLQHMIYSAIFDRRVASTGNCKFTMYNSNFFGRRRLQFASVKVFGVLPVIVKAKIKCLFKLHNDVWEEESIEAIRLHEYFETTLCSYIINCPLIIYKNQSLVRLPEEVAIVYDSNPQTYAMPTFVNIRYPENINPFVKSERNLSLCAAPLRNHYNNVLRLVEFIEIYRMLGVEKFYFYKMNVTANVEKLLSYYKNLSIIQVLPWNFYLKPRKRKIDQNGISVSINECVYRSTFVDKFKYTAVVDIDEILIPFKHATLTEYINEVDNYDAHSFIFRRVFFHDANKNDLSSVPKNVKNKYLYTQLRIHRTSSNFPKECCSKYIVRGERVLELGPNQVFNGIRESHQRVLPTDEALLFNYKTECTKYSCIAPLVVDFSARRFGSLIWSRVDQVCQSFHFGICPRND